MQHLLASASLAKDRASRTSSPRIGERQPKRWFKIASNCDVAWCTMLYRQSAQGPKSQHFPCEVVPIFVGSAVPNWLKVTTKAHDCASTPSSAQGVQTIVLVCAQPRPIEPRRPSGCRSDAGPATSHCSVRRCKVGPSQQKGPEPACGNGLSGGPGSTTRTGVKSWHNIHVSSSGHSAKNITWSLPH